MKYFIDTEFIEGFKKRLFGKRRHFIDLISIGIVCENGRNQEWLSREYNYNDAGQWVRENVILPLYKETVRGDNRNRYDIENFHKHYGKPNNRIANEVMNFCGGTSLSTIFYPAYEKDISFYGYYSDYDWVLFCSLFGRMIDLPKGFPMYCIDLKQMMDERELTKEWKKENCPDPEKEHSAIEDAKWSRRLYECIIKNPIHP